MPIKEKSFRIGCGRYVQEVHVIASLGEEVLRLGKSPLVVGDTTAISLTREKIQASLALNCPNYEIIEYNQSCNQERGRELADLANSKGYDVIVGVGGGVIMDFAKVIGYFAKRPVINVPTSSATCAAYTPLSVCYTAEGRTVGSLHYEHEVNAVLCDTEIIAAQPKRLLLAGAFDALAKFVEIKQRFHDEVTDFPLGLDWAYVLSKKSFEVLTNSIETCIEDAKQGHITDTVEQVIFTSIAVTGVISGIARGSNQTALAHKFYEGARAMYFEKCRPFLHGEIVGVGLLLQNFFNGEKENNDFLRALMKKYDMPCCVSDIGISTSQEVFEKFYEKLKICSAIEEGGEDAPSKLREALEYVWTLK